MSGSPRQRSLSLCRTGALLFLLGLGVQGDGRAQSPLTIEQLLVEASRLQLTANFSHRTARPGPWVAAEDTLSNLGVRYGLSADLEVNAGLQHSAAAQRIGASRQLDRFRAVNGGVNWRIKRETRTPALLLELRGTLRAWSDGGAYSFPRAELLLTGYKSVDPVVLSLTLAVEKSRSRREAGHDEDPGSGWRIEPMINFAVNPSVTLLGGFSHLRRTTTRRDGAPVALPLARTALRVGAGYAASENSTLFLTGDLASDSAGSALGLQWLYQF